MRYASTGAVRFTLQLKMADLRGHERSNLFKFAFISETVSDRVKRSEVFTLTELLHAK